MDSNWRLISWCHKLWHHGCTCYFPENSHQIYAQNVANGMVCPFPEFHLLQFNVWISSIFIIHDFQSNIPSTMFNCNNKIKRGRRDKLFNWFCLLLPSFRLKEPKKNGCSFDDFNSLSSTHNGSIRAEFSIKVFTVNYKWNRIFLFFRQSRCYWILSFQLCICIDFSSSGRYKRGVFRSIRHEGNVIRVKV